MRAATVSLPAGLRDLLPGEAAARRQLARRVLESFALHGYDLVTLPAFELAEVLERGLGTLDPRDVLRFVEPESGEVAALRPDMTPQIARMAATRLADRPRPMRLAYEGTILRRRQERARRHRQIPQAGVELLGAEGPAGDVELLALAAAALEAAGLSRFVVDFGHADIARALLGGVPAVRAAELLDALAEKDAARVADLARAAGLDAARVDALRVLPTLHGDGAVWRDAEARLGATAAAPAVHALRDLWDRAAAAGLERVLRVDLGEVRGFAYYTGAIFHLYADGPGEALGAGGRYDDLLARFGAPMPAAGFALDLDNLAWALEVAGVETREAPRAVVVGEGAAELATALRRRGVACVIAPAECARAHAEAWSFSHVVAADERTVTALGGATSALGASAPDDLADRIVRLLRAG